MINGAYWLPDSQASRYRLQLIVEMKRDRSSIKNPIEDEIALPPDYECEHEVDGLFERVNEACGFGSLSKATKHSVDASYTEITGDDQTSTYLQIDVMVPFGWDYNEFTGLVVDEWRKSSWGTGAVFFDIHPSPNWMKEEEEVEALSG
jgi:hypothetical protein